MATKTTKTAKGATVLEMIASAKGATTAALMKVTGWQAHTLRAFLSRARQDANIVAERADGETTYRIADGKPAAKKPAAKKAAKAKKPAKAKRAKAKPAKSAAAKKPAAEPPPAAAN
jgi:DNA-binding transcriptional regulator PaaX